MPMRIISPRFTVCIFLASLCTFISSTPLEKRPVEHVTQAPQIEQRDVWVTKYEVATAVDVNPPFYDTQCQVGGCTFNYEVSQVITFTAHLTSVVGLSFLLGQYVPEYSLSCHTCQSSDFNPSRWIADVCRSYFDVCEP